MKKVISIILVILWMILIFYLSNINGNDSHSKSVSGIESAITTTYTITDKIGITDNESNDKDKIYYLSELLNYPIRKCLHVLEYFILTILLINMFYQYNINYKKIILFSIIISFIYACSDEYHQIYTGRTSSFIDVIIDSIGSILSILLLMINNKKLKIFN